MLGDWEDFLASSKIEVDHSKEHEAVHAEVARGERGHNLFGKI